MINNPFSLTKANDLTDEQINNLWVDLQGSSSSTTLFDAGKFTSPMPTFILGGKGSGKTHLMRYASFPLQRIRFSQLGLSLIDGITRDGYLGIYVRCSGLDSGRFKGKGQPLEAWAEIFSYYLELWLGQSLLDILSIITNADNLQNVELSICEGVAALFDTDAPPASSFRELCESLNTRRKKLDYEVNNAAFTGKLAPGISLTRGRLIFGLPRLIAKHIPRLSNIQFCYQLDEFENLTFEQQVHLNTLVRERESPATFKIGARQFGIRTHRTLSADEENIRDSEYDELRLDSRFRENEDRYRELVERLVQRRLDQLRVSNSGKPEIRLKDWFQEPDLEWNSTFLFDLTGKHNALERPHMQNLVQHLRSGFTYSAAPGVEGEISITQILNSVSCEPFPLLEKLNILILFGEWSRGKDLLASAAKISHDCQNFQKGKNTGPYAEKLKRYKSDLVSQLLRENNHKQIYSGFSNFVRMSEGQPRALITLLKHTFDWALFQGEQPFIEGKITFEAQSKGAVSSAEWFYNSMMKAGTDGKNILISIDRLSQLFRLNRYSDKIRECSLIGFSASVFTISDKAGAVLKQATDRSFLVDIEGGQQERNSEQVTKKFQLNRMLVPRWGLGTARRGIIPFKPEEIEAIFDPDKVEEFAALRRDWETRAGAPLFGQKRQRLTVEDAAEDHDGQTDLFDR